MARVIRNTNKVSSDLALAINDVKAFAVASVRTLKADISGVAAVGSSTPSPGFHDDVSEKLVTLPTATDLPTAINLANDCRGVYIFHIADSCAHKAVDSANAPSAPLARDLATVIALANDLKAKYNLHRAVAASHSGGADSTNTVTSANATDLASSLTLVNELKTKINAHLASGPAVKSVRLIPA